MLFGIPLVALFKNSKLWRDKNLALLILFLIISLIIVYPRVSFFHMQLFIALGVSLWSYLLWKSKERRLITASFAIGLVLLLGTIYPAILRSDWQKEARFYGKEDAQLAQVIQEVTPQGGRVFFLGLHSGLYSMAGVLPSKRWTDNFGWYLEIPGVQEEIISRWEENSPAIVFWRTPSPGNWFDLGTYQPKKIARWIEEHYTKEKEIKPGVWLWTRKLVLSD